MLSILFQHGLKFFMFKLFKEMIISRWFDDAWNRFTTSHFGWMTGRYRRFGVTMSLTVMNQITFSKSSVITLGTKKRGRRFFVNGATMSD